ncbi:hypothetical protein Tco_1418258 [Tanacetum coccineum]
MQTVDINAIALLRQAIRSSTCRKTGTARPESNWENSVGKHVDNVVDDEVLHKLVSMVEKNEMFDELMIVVVDIEHILTEFNGKQPMQKDLDICHASFLLHFHVYHVDSDMHTADQSWDQVSILAKDKGFGQEMHQSEEPKALYGVTSPKDYTITYSNKQMSHHTHYGIKCLQDYVTTFKYTRDDVSDSALRRNICDRVTP